MRLPLRSSNERQELSELRRHRFRASLDFVVVRDVVVVGDEQRGENSDVRFFMHARHGLEPVVVVLERDEIKLRFQRHADRVPSEQRILPSLRRSTKYRTRNEVVRAVEEEFALRVLRRLHEHVVAQNPLLDQTRHVGARSFFIFTELKFIRFGAPEQRLRHHEFTVAADEVRRAEVGADQSRRQNDHVVCDVGRKPADCGRDHDAFASIHEREEPGHPLTDERIVAESTLILKQMDAPAADDDVAAVPRAELEHVLVPGSTFHVDAERSEADFLLANEPIRFHHFRIVPAGAEDVAVARFFEIAVVEHVRQLILHPHVHGDSDLRIPLQ